MGVISTFVYELIRADEVGGNDWLPSDVQRVAGLDPTKAFGSSEKPGETDPDLPTFDEAYMNPGLLQEFGVDGMMFEEYGARHIEYKGRPGRRKQVVKGIYAMVYVLDESGEYRTLASQNWFGDRSISVELQDRARKLAGRLDVPFQTI